MNADRNDITESTPFAAAVTPGRDKVSSRKSFRRYSAEQESRQQISTFVMGCSQSGI